MPKKESQTLLWWMLWITATIGSFFVASAFWTPLIAKHFGSIRETRTAILWVSAVFGTWMVILLPLIVMMYFKVDKAYEDARIRREKAASAFRSIFVEKSKRLLPDLLSKKLADCPEAIEGGHLVTLILKDGRRIADVYVSGRREVLGLYDFTQMPFEITDVADVEPADLNQLPHYFQSNWLRLDGVKN